MKHVARIISRGKIAGIFLPLQGGLPEGIYNVFEIMDEIVIKRVGKSAMARPRLNGLDLEGIFNERAWAGFTRKELKELESRRS